MLRRSASCCATGEILDASLEAPLKSRRMEEPLVEDPSKALSRSDLRQVELLGRSLSSNKLDDSAPLLGQVLVLARCRDRQSNELNLEWRTAFFAVSGGGVLRIFRSLEDRARWADLGRCGENLSKWRSAISDAHVVSCLRELPEHEARLCRPRKRAYCGATRARCQALGPTPIERDEDEDGEADVAHAPAKRHTADDASAAKIRGALRCGGSKPPYHTFDVWLRNDIANPNAKPVLKFAGRTCSSDIAYLHHALITCSHHFHGPKQTCQTFSHPLLAKYPNSFPVSIISS